MGERDHAIVIGVRRYPRFGQTILDADDLRGPDNDAKAVYDWLADPAKGAVPTSQIHCVRSADYADPFANALDAQPTTQDLVRAFSELENIAQENGQADKGMQVGRRLYVYAAGHGYAPASKQGAVFTAEATRGIPSNVDVTSWIDGFYDRKYFEEYVLWLDCCMSFLLAVNPGLAQLQKKMATGKNPKLVTMFAARKPKEAVEKQMDDGLVHGVFTWTLLQGLNGGAIADPKIGVTTTALRNYMITAMATYLSPTEKADDRLSQEPDFGSTDEITFVQRATKRFTIVLDFSAASAKQPVVVLGAGLKPVKQAKVAGPSMTLKLEPGFYAAVVDGRTTTFQVVGDSHVVVA